MTLFLLGLDGMSLDIIKSYSSKFELGNFRRLLSEGSAANLQSTYPFVTAPAWTSMFTGVNPGKHGIFDLVMEEEGQLRVPNMRNVEVPFLWDYLSWAKKRVLVLGVPFIYPAPQVNGYFVTGRLVPRLSCYPQSLVNRIDLSGFSPELDNSRLGNLLQGRNEMKVEKKEYAQHLLEALQKRKEAFATLVDEESWDVVIIVDSMPDQLFHKFWGNEEMIEKMLMILDEWLGEIMRRFNANDKLLVVSDHGFGDVKGTFYLKSWLISRGFLTTNNVVIASRKTRLIKKFNPFTLFDNIGRNLAKEYSSTSNECNNVKVTGVATSAWLSIPQHSPELKETLLKELAPIIQSRIISDCKRVEEIYSGQHIKEAPGDLLLIPSNGWSIDCAKADSSKDYRIIDYPKGGHTPDGIFICYKRDMVYLSQNLKIYDVMPTVLKMSGLSIPAFVDGKPAL
jgi:predicted AlkP superfamily phosphohydrolase/phosphomutase